MRLDVTQSMRMSQQMKLAPRIIQAMEILQLPMMELQERIERELEANPVLELRDEGVDEQAPIDRDDDLADRGEQALVVKDNDQQSEDFNRLDDFTQEYGDDAVYAEAAPLSRPHVEGERDRKLDAMANTAAPDQTLREFLTEQWAFVETDEPTKSAGLRIIDNVDDDGYLRVPLEDLAAIEPPIHPTVVRQALALVQQLEPTGVAARDVRECLLLQLGAESQAGADVSLEVELVSHFLRDIEANRLPQIARRTNRSVDEIKAAIENLSHLTPRPGSLVSSSTAPGIHPDVVIDYNDDGELEIRMDGGNSPLLRVSRSYQKMAKDRATDREAKRFLQKNIRSAQWLISAIEQRRETVRRVVQEVFAVQHDFIEEGPESLKPLPMADVAGKVGVHVATVSRAVAGKYVQTPRGVYSLRMFFSGGTTTAEGDDMSWDAVKAKLKEIVDSEDKTNPLNDDELADALQKEGIDIARRTVAKYRGLMEIPPARKRKEY